jgi:hypothetical protein
MMMGPFIGGLLVVMVPFFRAARRLRVDPGGRRADLPCCLRTGRHRRGSRAGARDASATLAAVGMPPERPLGKPMPVNR